MPEPEPMAQPDPTPDAERPDTPSWRRRAARLVLIAGFALAITQLLPDAPRDQALVFRLGADVAKVRRLEAIFTPDGESEATSGVTLSFSSPPPSRVHHNVSLPNGLYRIDLQVVREAAPGRLEHTGGTHRVRLEGEETVISVEPR